MGACLQTWEICGVKGVLRVRNGRGELELGSADDEEVEDDVGSAKNEGEGLEDHLNQVNDCPLELGDCEVADAGCQVIADIVKVNDTIEELDLPENTNSDPSVI